MKTVFYAVIAWLLCCMQSTAQQVNFRLVAKARWLYNGNKLVPADSVYLSYSGDNACSVPGNDCRYDTSVWIGTSATGMKNRERSIRKYIGRHVVEQVNEEWLNTSWKLRNKLIYNYDVNRLLSTTYAEPGAGTSWRPLHKDSNVYDADNRLVETMHLSPNGSSWGHSGRRLFSYATTGLLEQVKPFDWNSATGGWKEKLQASYYYTENNLVALTHRYGDGAADSNTYTYDDRGNLIEDRRYQNISPTQWEPAYRFLYTYDDRGNQTSMTVLLPDINTGAYVNRMQLKTVYNNAAQPLTETRYGWNAKTQQFDRTEAVNYFYFEGNKPGMTEAVQAPGTIKLHPNPASNTLNLNLQWNEAQSATAVLFDMSGKVAGQWTMPVVMQHTQALDISNVASGNYLLKVIGAKGQLSKQVTVVRQFN